MNNPELKELIKNKKNLADVLNWFIVENNLSVEPLTSKEIDALVKQIKKEDEVDADLLANLIKKIK